MTRRKAIQNAWRFFDSGEFWKTLARRIGLRTESQDPTRKGELIYYLDVELRRAFESMGFQCVLLTHPQAHAPFLFAQRLEDASRPTVLGYGHGDVVYGLEAEWSEGLGPWMLTSHRGLWYGRGVSDNKGQHTVNLAAMRSVLQTRGRLGFNAKYLIEMGEEISSPGLYGLCEENRDRFAADVLLASDGPRLRADRPTIFLGSRGCVNFDLSIDARQGGRHSGNWGGLISNPGIQLAHAISSLVSRRGQIRIPDWVPAELPDSVRRALIDCKVGEGGVSRRSNPIGENQGCRPPNAFLAGALLKSWPSRLAILIRQPMRFRPAPGRVVSCALWLGLIWRAFCQRYDAT